MEKYRVTLVPEERAALEQLISRGKSASRKLTHARILLLADGVRGEGHADDEIVTALGTSLKTIARVRKRFVVEGLEAAIDHRPQPPRPDKIKIKGDVEQKLVQVGLQRSAPRPLPLDLATAGRRNGRLGVGRGDQHRDGASGAEKNDIQPWIVQTWCIPPKANAEFVWRMEDVIQTYMRPYDPR